MHRLLRLSLLIPLLLLLSCSSDRGSLFTPVLTGAAGSTLPQKSRILTATVAGFLEGRTCWIYLPPGYDPARRRYPVLYMHDGQELFGPDTQAGGATWHLETTCDSLILGMFVEPFIVIGIRSNDRFYEYTPFDDNYWNGNEGGGDEYVRAIVEDLKPAIDQSFATRRDPAHTMIAGSSLGGLISMYAAYARPDVFGRVASFSGAFYGDFFDYVDAHPSPPLYRMYLDSGSDNSFGTSLMYDRAVAQGFVPGDDLLRVSDVAHDHSPMYWGLRFPGAIEFLMSGIPASPAP